MMVSRSLAPTYSRLINSRSCQFERPSCIRCENSHLTAAFGIRISAGLVLLFGQPVHRLVAMRIEDTDTTGTATAMRHATLAGADFLAYAATRTSIPTRERPDSERCS